ncbi:MAG: dipeptidase [Nesterenkonia sp.]|nr:dipeptidase [Nesterenkonia sp.]
MSSPTIPVFDGHNDLPWHLRETRGSSVSDLHDEEVSPFTTIPQIRRGGLAAQFWSVYVHSSITGPEAVKATLEQIDLVHRLVEEHPDDFAWALTAQDVRRTVATGRVASLLGVEGGQQIDGSLAALRMYARLGTRYMTLTWSTTHSWADSATDVRVHGGLTEFGREVVAEMNRIGMIVDLSHVSDEVMHQALDLSTLPVKFSHSSARSVTDHPRNIPDDVLDRLPGNGGVAMATFVPRFVSDRSDDDGGAVASVEDVADHVDHLRERVGVDHVGLGGDLCGTPTMPAGLESAADYPRLFSVLADRGWSDADLRRLGFENAARVLEANDPPYLAWSGGQD